MIAGRPARRPPRDGAFPAPVAGVAAALAVVVAACGGRAGPPPEAEHARLPDAVGVATSYRHVDCQAIELTLESGEELTFFSEGVRASGCPDAGTNQILGRRSDLTFPAVLDDGTRGRGPLIFAGSGDGGAWVGSVSWDPFRDLWCFRFDPGDGAHLREDLLRLTNGLEIPLAETFEFPTYPPDPFPLRAGDQLCLDAKAQAVSVQISIPY